MNSSRNVQLACGHWRRGSSLIMVLVVMIVLGLVASQTSQLLVAFHSNDRHQRVVEQAQELIEIGIVKAQASLSKEPDYRGETITVDVWDSSRREGDFLAKAQGRIQIEVLPASPEKPTHLRIRATYPLGQTGEIVSKWESPP